MNLKNMILYIKSANSKLEDKFNNLSNISANMLIFGQLAIMLILGVILIYANRFTCDSQIFPDIFKSMQIVFENAASGLFILWLGAIFLDYIEKKEK